MRPHWLSLLSFPLLASSAYAKPLPPQASPSAGGVQVVLDFRDEVTPEDVAAFEAQYGISTRLNSVHADGEELRVAELPAAQAEALLAAMQGDARLEHAERSFVYSIPEAEALATGEVQDALPGDFPNDPKYKHQWHLDQIRMPEAWTAESGKGAIVAVIDTGVAYEDHGRFKKMPDLAETCFVPGYDFVNKSTHANDDHGHGTHVAGTVAQSTNNGIGVAGVAFRACIMPIKVLAAQGGGTTADIADGIKFAADHGAHVINMSLGGPFPSAVMRDAVEYARKKGVTVIAAAGNNGWKKVGYPAAYEGVVAVSATDLEDNLTFYSNYGQDIDIAAPGGDTRQDKNKDGVPDGVLQNTLTPGNVSGNDYYPYMGTSMASPHVAGVAALIVASGVTKPDAVEKILFETADRAPAERNGAKKGEKWDEKYGFGRVDAASAIAKATEEPNQDRSVLALLVAGLSVLALRRRGQLGVTPGASFGLGLASGAVGPLFFLPWVGVSLGGASLLAQGLPSWDLALGASWHGNVVAFSALLPVLAVGLLGGSRWKGLAAGLSFGVAAHLGYAAYANHFDISLLPGTLLDQVWLVANAALAALLGHLTLKRA